MTASALAHALVDNEVICARVTSGFVKMQTINIWTLIWVHPKCLQPALVALGTRTTIFNRARTFACATFAVQSCWVANAVLNVNEVAIASEAICLCSRTRYYRHFRLRDAH